MPANSSNKPSRTNDKKSIRSKSATSKARSRSEIEDALNGRTRRNKPKARPEPANELGLDVPPRRQQVIGGKLSGVSNRSKFGIFSRYSDVSIVNWVAGAIVLLILAAFFWPQQNDSTKEVAGSGVSLAPQLGETDLSKQEQVDFIESESSADGFSRDNDLDRAGEYREQDAIDLQIRALLQEAKLQVQQGYLTQPDKNNAAETYRAVLALKPNNVTAKQGLDSIVSQFSTSGYTALEQNNISVAQSALQKLIALNADSDESNDLRIAIDQWKANKKIQDLLAEAEQALAGGDLILPASRNALALYRQVLALDDSNQAAIDGVQSVADSFVQQANDAVLNGQYEAASAHLATVSIIDPENSSIALVEAMIARAKPIAEQALAAQEALERQNQDVPDVAPSSVPSNPTTLARDTKTPPTVSSEQETFDRQYLKQGLEAYYAGDYDTSAALLQPLADKGIARAQFRLAYMHYLGRGFNRDRAVADQMIRAALPAIQRFADDGRAWAQSDLGSLYEDGLVLPRNYTDAVYWYRSAAEQDYPGAQTNLGIMYARGRGVAASRRTAIEWFRRAAEQGDSVAQRNLEALGAN